MSASTTTTTPPEPTRADLENVYGLLCDLVCAADENGNDELSDKLNEAADIVERAIDATKPEAERGFGA